MDLIANVLIETARILYEGSLFILLGFLIAGLLHEFMPTNAIARHLGRDDTSSVTLAALFGAPIPLCSCGVLPAAAALRNKGASRSALLSFLISTPETGVDSIALTYGLLGPVMAIVRPVVAVITAIVAGLVSILLPETDEDLLDERLGEAEDSCHQNHTHAPGEADHEHPQGGASYSGGSGLRPSANPTGTPADRTRRVLNYGFGTLLDEIAFWMALGIGLTGVLAALLPSDFFSAALGLDRGIMPMLLMIVAGLPLYLCASASTPVAAALIAKGLSPGAALVFLLVGPATNAATITVVGKLLGSRRLKVYMASIIGVSLAAGIAVDAFGGEAVRATAFSRTVTPGYDLLSILKLGAAFVFSALLWTSLRRIGLSAGLSDLRGQAVRMGSTLSGLRLRDLIRPPVLAATAVLIVPFALPRFALVVEPGQRGVVQRFGHVTAGDLAPGLHWHLPPPLGRGTAVDVDRIRAVPIGFEETERGGRLVLEAEAYYLTADENLIDIRSVVTYQVSDPVRVALGTEDPDLLVRGVARRALVGVVSTRSIDGLYTSGRREAELAYRDAIENYVRIRRLGIRIKDARFLDAHAPAAVHDAFRDIASALEDRETDIYVARGYALEREAEASGESVQRKLAADGDSVAMRLRAAARARAFTALEGARAGNAVTTDYRLSLESIDRTLAGTPLYIHDRRYHATDIDLWLGFGALTPPSGSPLAVFPITSDLTRDRNSDDAVPNNAVPNRSNTNGPAPTDKE